MPHFSVQRAPMRSPKLHFAFFLSSMIWTSTAAIFCMQQQQQQLAVPRTALFHTSDHPAGLAATRQGAFMTWTSQAGARGDASSCMLRLRGGRSVEDAGSEAMGFDFKKAFGQKERERSKTEKGAAQEGNGTGQAPFSHAPTCVAMLTARGSQMLRRLCSSSPRSCSVVRRAQASATFT
eukprot:397566-Rhodomonas_salina.1